jgi:YbdK family carboxylate-amine ligase
VPRLRGRELVRLRAQAAAAAAAEDLDIVALGLHPFSGWRGHELSDGERYEGIAQRYGRLAHEEHIFGMHVHVAPPASEDRMVLLNTVRRYVPHLLALSCSSPFYEGEDTGFASFRMILWRRWPGAGLPPRLADDAEYRRYVDAQLRAGLLQDERSLYWMIRRHPEYPTLEFRMCDVCPRIDDAIAIAALARCIVAGSVEGVLRPFAPVGMSAEAADALLSDDAWRAARYGLAARFAEPERGGAAVSARSAIARLVERLAPVAERLGEAEWPGWCVPHHGTGQRCGPDARGVRGRGRGRHARRRPLGRGGNAGGRRDGPPPGRSGDAGTRATASGTGAEGCSNEDGGGDVAGGRVGHCRRRSVQRLGAAERRSTCWCAGGRRRGGAHAAARGRRLVLRPGAGIGAGTRYRVRLDGDATLP